MPYLGMLDTEEIDRAIDEIKEEVDARRRRGSTVDFPNGDALKQAISNRVWLNRKEAEGPGNPKIDLDQVKNAVNESLTDNKKAP